MPSIAFEYLKNSSPWDGLETKVFNFIEKITLKSSINCFSDSKLPKVRFFDHSKSYFRAKYRIRGPYFCINV